MTPEPIPHVLVVTSAGAHAAVVVPVLAALEAAGMRVRAIDVGAAGGGGHGMADRVRRALLGESAERRLERELRGNPPDVAVAFDPHATMALTVARDQAAAIAPVIGVVGELEPDKAWAEAAADRLCAIDPDAAVALADAGVEAERILVVGPFGPRAWADAAREEVAALRARFKLGGAVALIEVAGMGAEATSSLAMQLSLSSIGESATFLFDAGSDVEAAATLRAKVPVLGIKAKLFGATADAPLLWRAADVVVARPRAESVAKAALVGARMVALVDDTVPGAARVAAAIEQRKLGVAARSPLLIAAALESLLKARGGGAQPDGAETVADVAWVVAGDKRGVVEERRAAQRADAHEKVRAATSAAQAAARVAAVPGELEDLGGGGDDVAGASVPDDADLSRLLAETEARKKDMERAMMAARAAADNWTRLATSARGAGKPAEAADADRRAEAERARMHGLLGELGQLEAELADLRRAVDAARRAGPTVSEARRRAAAPPPPRRDPLEDLLANMKKQAPPSSKPSSAGPSPSTPASTVDDELEALKRKMAQTPQKKKP